MIGHDEVYAKALRGFGRSEGANAHVDADDQSNSGRRGALDHIVAQIVAFTNAVRDMKVGGAAAEFDRGLQNDDCHRAIHVVVAVDQHGLFPFDGRVQAVDGGAQASHLFGRIKVIDRGSKETCGGFRFRHTAPNEQPGERVKVTATCAIG